jgi:hypothetical protein
MGASIDFKESRKRELFEMENELGITGDLRFHKVDDNINSLWDEFFIDLLGYKIPNELIKEKILKKYYPPVKK